MTSTTTTSAPAWEKLTRLDQFHHVGTNGQYTACCPAAGHDDTEPSLSIGLGADGRVLLKCHKGCSLRDILEGIGCSPADLYPPNGHQARPSAQRRRGTLAATYDYRDERGTLLYQAVRYADPKGFLQRRPDPDGRGRGGGGWRWKLDGVRRVPYRLPQVLAALAADPAATIFLVEGEKDADRLAGLGLVATTTAEGATNPRHTAAELATVVRGRRVVVVQDMDASGDIYARDALKYLREHTAAIAVLRLPRLVHLPTHGLDVSDWLDDPQYGGTVEELGALAEEALEHATEQPKMPDGAKDAPSAYTGPMGIFDEGGHLWRGVRRLSEVTPETVRWLWPGRIPLGKVTLIEGDPDLGKSLACADLAARVTTGRAMPDGSRGELAGMPAGVVIASAEDDAADTIRPRFDAASGDASRVLTLDSVPRVSTREDGSTEETEGTFCIPGDLGWLREVMTHIGARLVVLDPLVAYLPPGQINSWRDQDVRAALAPLGKLAAEMGAAIVCVRHLIKANGSAPTNPLYRGGGSIGIIGAARSALLAALDPDDPDQRRRILARVKGNLAAPVPALEYRIEVTPAQVPYVVWEGPTAHTAAQLLAAPTDAESKSETDEAVEWLRAVLTEAGGSLPARDVQAHAKREGISEKVLRSARLRICERPQREGFGGAGG